MYEGHIENGVVVFDEPVALPNGTAVRVEPVSSPKLPDTPSLLERLGCVGGAVHDLPPDAAQNVDHYLYGQPKS